MANCLIIHLEVKSEKLLSLWLTAKPIETKHVCLETLLSFHFGFTFEGYLSKKTGCSCRYI